MKKNQIIGIGLVVVLIAMYVGIKMYASSVVEKKIDSAIAGIANYASVDYENVSVDLFGLNAHISGVVVSSATSEEKLNIREIVIYDLDEKSDIPLFMDISFNGIDIDIDTLGGNAKKIKELGYTDNILLNLAIEYHYSKEESEIVLNKLKIGADDVGDLEVGFRFGNIELNPEKIVTILFTYPRIMLYHAKISYHDDSLIERLLKLAAKQRKENVIQVKKEVIETIEKKIEKENDRFTKNALIEIKSFIVNPKKLMISVTPKKPLPLGRLLHVADPKDMIKLLNIEIKS